MVQIYYMFNMVVEAGAGWGPVVSDVLRHERWRNGWHVLSFLAWISHMFRLQTPWTAHVAASPAAAERLADDRYNRELAKTCVWYSFIIIKPNNAEITCIHTDIYNICRPMYLWMPFYAFFNIRYQTPSDILGHWSTGDANYCARDFLWTNYRVLYWEHLDIFVKGCVSSLCLFTQTLNLCISDWIS